MNPMNVFSVKVKYIDDDHKRLVKAMQQEAWRLAKLGVMGRLFKKDLVKYEKMCYTYQEKYPTEDFTKTLDRLNKLKTISK